MCGEFGESSRALSFARETALKRRFSFFQPLAAPAVFHYFPRSLGGGGSLGWQGAEGAEGGALPFETGQPRFSASVWVIPHMCLRLFVFFYCLAHL